MSFSNNVGSTKAYFTNTTGTTKGYLWNQLPPLRALTGDWAARAAGTIYDRFDGITNDIGGNVFAVGQYSSNPTTIYHSNGATYGTLTNSGSNDGLIVKYNPAGTAQWATRIAGDVALRGVVTDSNGDLYVSGDYSLNPMTVYNAGGGVFGTVVNQGFRNILLVKYNTSGTALWATHIGGTDGDSGYDVTVDLGGNVYVTGNYASWNPTGPTVYNSDGSSYTALDGADLIEGIVVKYNSSGMAQWVSFTVRVGFDGATTIESAWAENGNVYVAGHFSVDPLNIYNGSQYGTAGYVTITNSGTNDGLIVKYNLSGTIQWTTRIGGDTEIDSITTDNSGNVFVLGYYTSNPTTIYNAGGGTFGTLANSGSMDTLVVKYNSSGTAQWAARVGGTAFDLGYGDIVVDSGGNIFISGYYESSLLSVYNSDGTVFGTLTTTVADGFVVRYNSSGMAQEATRTGGGDGSYINAMTVDNARSVYVAGSFYANPVTIYNSNNTTFGTLTNSGQNDAFIVKYSSPTHLGTARWATHIGGGSDEKINGIAVNSSGDIYIAGNYSSNPVTVYNLNDSVFGTLANSGTDDGLIVKYNSSGIAQWTTRISGGTEILDVTTNAANVFVTGTYTSNPVTIYNVGGGTFGTLANSGSMDTLVVKYNLSGTAQWATRIAGTGDESSIGGIASDPLGNTYVTGYYTSSPVTIYNSGGTTFGTLANSGLRDIFLVKYSQAGAAHWAARVSGVDLETSYGIASDSNGNVYISGYYASNPVIIYNSNGTTFGTLTNTAYTFGFVIKYNSTGTAQWATRIGGDTTISSVATDTNGNVYVSGYYASNPVTVYNSDGSTFQALQSSQAYDIIIVKYNSAGFGQWATRIGGTGVFGYNSIATDSTGNVFVSGYYSSSTITVYNSSGFSFGTLTNSGSTDGIIVKYDSTGKARWMSRLGNGTINSIAVDSTENVYVGGNYDTNPMTVYNSDETTFRTVTNTGNIDGFLVKFV